MTLFFESFHAIKLKNEANQTWIGENIGTVSV
jgi:hypothetical protein